MPKRSLNYKKQVYGHYLHLKDDPSLLEFSPPHLQRELHLLQDIVKNDLSLGGLEKKYLLSRSVISHWVTYLQSQDISFQMPFVRKYCLSADSEQEALTYLQDPTISHKEIADTLSNVAIRRLYHAHADILPERKKRTSTFEIKAEKISLRDASILEEAKTFRFTLEEIGQKDGRNLTSQRITQILQGFGFENYKKRRSEYNKSLHKEHKELVGVLQQYYFDRHIEEKGLDHALAWRCKEVYGWGTSYSLEALEKLIAARRAGEGYYRCVKLAGIGETRKEIRSRTPHMAAILKKALCDVVLDIHHKNFAEGRSLSFEEKEKLKEMWNRGESSHEIKETLHLVSPTSYYVRKLGLKKREIPILRKIFVDYSSLDHLISGGKTYSEMESLGFPEHIIRRRKKELGLVRKSSQNAINYSILDALLFEEKSNREIVEAGFSKKSIFRRRKELGVSRRKSLVNYSILDRLLSEGKTNKEIITLGFSRVTITRRKEKLELEKEK